VLQVSLDDRTICEIADGLAVSAETVMSHRKRILKKWLLITELQQGGKKAFRQLIRRVVPFLP
jgi:DNA-binding NarL/FixJ family response regulator